MIPYVWYKFNLQTSTSSIKPFSLFFPLSYLTLWTSSCCCFLVAFKPIVAEILAFKLSIGQGQTYIWLLLIYSKLYL